MRITRPILIGMTVLCSAGILALAQPTGTSRIRGAALADNGVPIAGATVTCVGLANPGITIAPPGTTPSRIFISEMLKANTVSATAISDARGGFEFPNLPAGKYTLCAIFRAGGYLNPCEWEPRVELRSATRMLATMPASSSNAALSSGFESTTRGICYRH